MTALASIPEVEVAGSPAPATATGMGRTRLAIALCIGYGTAVAMWLTGFFCRLPAASVHEASAPDGGGGEWVAIVSGPLLFFLMVLLMVVGGALAGRAAGALTAAAAGLVTAVINLLLLGAQLADGEGGPRPATLVWVLGFLVTGAAIGAVAGAAGARLRPAGGESRLALGDAGEPSLTDWLQRFALVGVAATLSLILVGGLVTSMEAGLAVPDWPTSYEYNMFLFPLSRMVGGVFYEHAHRLFGSLVGLTTLSLAISVFLFDSRRWLRYFGLSLVVVVSIQGIMGGLRVTEQSNGLAMTHGIVGQVFLAMAAGLAVFASRAWIRPPSLPAERAAAVDRAAQMAKALVAALSVQLFLGALLRHTGTGLMLHIFNALVVLGLALAATLGVLSAHGRLTGASSRLALLVGALALLQLVLGFAALVATSVEREPGVPPHLADVVLTTLHQATGASLFAASAALALLACRASCNSLAGASGATRSTSA